MRAEQMANLRAANALIAARDAVLSTRSLICWSTKEVREIDQLVDRIDTLINKVLP